jgi:hypothetical protein
VRPRHWARARVLGSFGKTVELTKAILGSIGYGLISPGIFIPALVVGWFVHRWWQVAVGSIAIAVISLLWGLTVELPEGAEIIWPTMPIDLIPPFVWGAAGFLARNWYRRRAAVGRPGVAVSLFPIVVGVLVGGFGGGVIGSLTGMVYVALAQVSSFEGESGFVVAAFMLLGVVIGIVAGGLAGFLRGRASHSAHPQGEASIK